MRSGECYHGRYRILHQLDEKEPGGQGEVYLAEELPLIELSATDLERLGGYPLVAIKRFKRIAKPAEEQRVFRAIVATASLDHLHLLRYRHCFRDDEARIALVTDYAAGGSTGKLVEALQPLRDAQRFALVSALVAEVIGPVARALEYLHTRGLVHRDLKPANILLMRWPLPEPLADHLSLTAHSLSREVRLADLGLVRALHATIDKTSCPGTFDYASPEVLGGGPKSKAVPRLASSSAAVPFCEEAPAERLGEVGTPSDVYSLAVTAFELLLGRLPFQGTLADRLLGHLEQAPPIPDNLPEPWPALLHACLDKRPGARWSAARVAEELHYLETEAARRIRREQEALHQERRAFLDLQAAAQQEQATAQQQQAAEQQRLTEQQQRLAAEQQRLAAEQQRLAEQEQQLAAQRTRGQAEQAAAAAALTTARQQQEHAVRQQQAALATEQQQQTELRASLDQAQRLLQAQQAALATERQQQIELRAALTQEQRLLQAQQAALATERQQQAELRAALDQEQRLLQAQQADLADREARAATAAATLQEQRGALARDRQAQDEAHARVRQEQEQVQREARQLKAQREELLRERTTPPALPPMPAPPAPRPATRLRPAWLVAAALLLALGGYLLGGLLPWQSAPTTDPLDSLAPASAGPVVPAADVGVQVMTGVGSNGVPDAGSAKVGAVGQPMDTPAGMGAGPPTGLVEGVDAGQPTGLVGAVGGGRRAGTGFARVEAAGPTTAPPPVVGGGPPTGIAGVAGAGRRADTGAAPAASRPPRRPSASPIRPTQRPPTVTPRPATEVRPAATAGPGTIDLTPARPLTPEEVERALSGD